MIRKLARVLVGLALIAFLVVAADWLGARSALRIAAHMVTEHADLAAASRTEQLQLAAERQDRVLQQQLVTTCELQANLQDVQAALEAKLHQQRTTVTASQQQAERIKDCYQAALARGEWPAEYCGQSYQRAELEAQVKELLVQAVVSRKICEQLGEMRNRLATEQARLAIDRDYRELQALTTATLRRRAIESAAAQE